MSNMYKIGTSTFGNPSVSAWKYSDIVTPPQKKKTNKQKNKTKQKNKQKNKNKQTNK